MPKQVVEINPFHGGMNENSDARDLAHDELVSAVDVMVDKIGQIRTGPSIAAHASASPTPPTTDDISDRLRTSLFAFSHDYDGAGEGGDIIQNGSSNMNSGSIWGGWSGGTDWNASASYFTFTGTTGGSNTITQTAANRIRTGVGGKSYILTYTISNYTLTSGSPSLKLLGGSGQFADSEQTLTLSNGTHRKTFTSHSSASTAVFSLQSASVQVTFRLDDIQLELSPSSDTGQDYLAMYLNTSATNYGFAIYGYTGDYWTDPQNNGMRFHDVSTSAEPVFTYVDGVLRVVDKLKGQNCYKIWYSYIERNRWGTTSVGCKRWVNAQSPLTAPTDANVPFETGGTGPYTPSEGEFKIGVPYGFTTNVADAGGWNPNGITGTATGGSGANKLVSSSTTFTSNMVGMRVRRTNNTTATAIITGFEDANTIHCSKTIAEDDTSTAAGNTLTWSSGGTADTFEIYDFYELGVTFVYDGNQESLIHNRTSFGRRDKKNWVFNIEDIACGHSWDSETTARITGANLYYRKESDDTNTWYHLAEVDFNKGFRLSNEDDFSITWVEETARTEYLLNDIYIENPLTFETYETRNGFKSDSTNLLDLSANYAGYSASVVANRVHYIANVKYSNKDGVMRNHGDVMFKSVVNKFDTFPLDRKVEVSVQDGDEITALASYADRILQFKKNKMHLINVSQEVEFLEDTFKFKGVYDQSAVCETDYGIAWVNTFGAYLYDGQKVIDLTEQKGVRKIAPTQSSINLGLVYNSSFRPMIAYLPHQRQLLIAKDGGAGDGAANHGDAWIYDMVTQSWTLQRGDGEFITADGAGASNFVTDHLGNVVFFTGTGSLKTVDTSGAAKTQVQIKTADMNFGNSAIRKKIYRVRVSYKGDASSLIVKYSVNGDTNTFYNFQGTSSGVPTGVADTTPLENKSGDTSVWHHAELKPATSSEATNIYSFQVHIGGTGTDGTVGSTFRLNDLSVIYRVKNIK